jgi:hypothetical protein
MRTKTIPTVLIALCLGALCESSAFAQGGWDVWTVQLRDGTKIEAAPVWSLDKNELRYSFGKGGAGKGEAVERSRISYISNNLGNSVYRASQVNQGVNYTPPELPPGDVAQDLVVMDDGRQVSGTVMIKAGTDKSGNPAIYSPVLVQNGVETDLTRVAHIKFASPKAKSKAKSSKVP